MSAAVAEPPVDGSPAGASVEHVVARDGTSLLLRHWPVPAGEAWAAMLLVHGLAEHSGRYEHVGSALARAGIDAHAFDLRGFGGSGGARAWIDRWSQFHDDLEERLVAVRSIAPARPLVLFGHSMGGLVALGYVLDGRARPDLLVLSAPAIRANIPRWQRVLVSSLGRVRPRLRIANGIDPEDLSSDPRVGEAYVADPLNQHRSTVRFAHAGFGEQRRVAAAAHRLSIPTLVIHATEDAIVPPAASAGLTGLAGVTRRTYDGFRHELHNEPGGPAVVGDVINWVRDRVSRIHAPAG